MGLAEIVEQIYKVGRALAGAGTHAHLAPDRIEGAAHGAPPGLAGGLDAQVRAALGPAMGQVGMGARLGLVEEEQIDRARRGLPLQLLQPAAMAWAS